MLYVESIIGCWNKTLFGVTLRKVIEVKAGKSADILYSSQSHTIRKEFFFNGKDLTILIYCHVQGNQIKL